MKAEYINPFVDAVYELYSTMLGAKVTRKGLAVSRQEQQPREVMAIIGFSGAVKGTAALALPGDTAKAMTSRILGEDDTSDDEKAVSDTIAELVNIIAGSAKAKLSTAVGQTLDLSLPVVLRGQNYQVDSPTKCTWLEVPFESDLGDFSLRVSLDD
jgi:chemotaxis protein CheX